MRALPWLLCGRRPPGPARLTLSSPLAPLDASSYIIPPEQGDVLVLIVQHPGSNALRSFYPSVFAPSFLCPVMLSGGGGGDGQSVGDDGVGGMAPRERSEAAGAVGTDGEGGSGGGEPEGLTMVPLESPPVEVAPQDEVLDLTEIDLASFLECVRHPLRPSSFRTRFADPLVRACS